MCQATGLQCFKCRAVNNAIKYRCARPYICRVDIQGIRQSRFPCLRCRDRENPSTPILGLNSGFSQIAAAASYLREHETPAARVTRLAREARLALRDQKPIHSLGHKYQFSEYTRHFMRRTGHRPFHYNAIERKRWIKRIRNLEEMACQSERDRERIPDHWAHETRYPPSASARCQAAQTSSTRSQSSYSRTPSRSRSSQPLTPTSGGGFLSRVGNLLRSGSSASANQFQQGSLRSRGEERSRHQGDWEHHDDRDRDCDRDCRGESWRGESHRSGSRCRGHDDDDSHNCERRVESRCGEDSHHDVRDARDSHYDDRRRRDRAPRTPIDSDRQLEVTPPMLRDPSSSESHALPFLRRQNATVSQQQQPDPPSPIGRTPTLARVAQLHRQDISLGKEGNPQSPTDGRPLTPLGIRIPALRHSNASIGQEARSRIPTDDSVPPIQPGAARPSSFQDSTSYPIAAAAIAAVAAAGSPIAPSLIAPLSVTPSAIRRQNFIPAAPGVTSHIAPGQHRGSSNFVPPTLQPEVVPSHRSGTRRHVNINAIRRVSAASRQTSSSGEHSKSNISSSGEVVDDRHNDRYCCRDDDYEEEGKDGLDGDTRSPQARCRTSIQNMHSARGRGFINEPLSDIEDADSVASDQDMDGPMMKSDYTSLRNAFLKTTRRAHELQRLPAFEGSGSVTELETIIKFHNIIHYRVTRFSAYKRVIKRNKRTAYVNADGQFLEKEFERDIGVLDRFLNRLSKAETEFSHASEVCNQVIGQVRLQEQRRQPTTPQDEVTELFARVDDKINQFNYPDSPAKSQTPCLSQLVGPSEIDRNSQAEREIAARRVQFAPETKSSTNLQRALRKSMGDSGRKSSLSSPSEQVNPACRPQDANTAATHHLSQSTNPDDIKQYLLHSQRQRQTARIQANPSFLEALSPYAIEQSLKVEEELESAQRPLRSTNPEDMIQFLLQSQQMTRAVRELTLGNVISPSEMSISHRAQQELDARRERMQSEIDLQEAFKNSCPTVANPIDVLPEAESEEARRAQGQFEVQKQAEVDQALQESRDDFHHPISFLTRSEIAQQQRAHEKLETQKRTAGPTQSELAIEQAMQASLQETTRHQFANLGGLIDPSELDLAHQAALAHDEQRRTLGPSAFQVALDQAIEASKSETHCRLSLRKTPSGIQMEEALELNRNIAQQSPHACRRLSVRFADTPSEIQLQEVLEYSKSQTRNAPQGGSGGTSVSSTAMKRPGHVHRRTSMPSLNVTQSELETQCLIEESFDVSTKPKSPALKQTSSQADFQRSLELSRQQSSPTNTVRESSSAIQMRQALEEYARLAAQKAKDNCLKEELRKAEELSRQSVDKQEIKRLEHLEATRKRLEEAEKKRLAEKKKRIIEEKLARAVKRHELVRAKARKEEEDRLRKEKEEGEGMVKNEAALGKIEEKKKTTEAKEAEEAAKRKKEREEKDRRRKLAEKSAEAKRVADLKAAAEKQAAEESHLQKFANEKDTSENYFVTQPIESTVPASGLVVESKPSKPVSEVKPAEPVSESNSNESITKEVKTTELTAQSTQTPKTESSVIKDTKTIPKPTKKSKTPVIDNRTPAEKAKNKAKKTHMKTIKCKERREKLHTAIKAKVKAEESAKRLSQCKERCDTRREEREAEVKEKRAKLKEEQAKAKAERRAENITRHDARNQELKDQAAAKSVEEHATWKKKRAEKIDLAKSHRQQAKCDLRKQEAEREALAKKTKNIAKAAEFKRLANKVKTMKSEARAKHEAQFLAAKERKEKSKSERHARHLETQKVLRAQKRERLHTARALVKSQRQQAHLARQGAQQRTKAARKAANILTGTEWVKKRRPRNGKPVESESKPKIDLPRHRFQVPDLVYPHPLTKIKDVKVSEPFPLGKHAVSLPFLKEDAKKEAEANEVLFHQIQQRKPAKYDKGLYEPSEEEKTEVERVRNELKEKICKVLGVGTKNPVEETVKTADGIVEEQEKEMVEEEVKEEEEPEDVAEELTTEPKGELKLEDFFAHRERVPEVTDEMVANVERPKHTPRFDEVVKMTLTRFKEYIRNKSYHQPWKLPGFPKAPMATTQNDYGFSKAQSGTEYLKSLQQVISDHRERVQRVYSVFNSDDPVYDQYDNDETTDPRITPMPDSREESDVSDNDAASVAHADRQAAQLEFNSFVPIYRGSKAEYFEELKKEGKAAYLPFANRKIAELADILKAEEDATEEQFEEVAEKYGQNEDTTKENDEPVQEEIQDETVEEEKKESTKLPEVTTIKVRYTRYEYPILDYEVHPDDDSSNMGPLVPDIPYPFYEYYYDYPTGKEEKEVEDQVPELEKSSSKKDAISATAAATRFFDSSGNSSDSSDSDYEEPEPKKPEDDPRERDDPTARPFYGRRFTGMFQRPKILQVIDDAISPRSFPTLQDGEDNMKSITKVQRLRMEAKMAAQKRRGAYYVKMRQVAEGTWVKYCEQ